MEQTYNLKEYFESFIKVSTRRATLQTLYLSQIFPLQVHIINVTKTNQPRLVY